MKAIKIILACTVIFVIFGGGFLYAQAIYSQADDATAKKIAQNNAEVALYNMDPDSNSKYAHSMDKLTAAYMNAINNKAALMSATSLAASTTHYDRASKDGMQSTSDADLAIIQIAQNQRIIELLQHIDSSRIKH